MICSIINKECKDLHTSEQNKYAKEPICRFQAVNFGKPYEISNMTECPRVKEGGN